MSLTCAELYTVLLTSALKTMREHCAQRHILAMVGSRKSKQWVWRCSINDCLAKLVCEEVCKYGNRSLWSWAKFIRILTISCFQGRAVQVTLAFHMSLKSPVSAHMYLICPVSAYMNLIRCPLLKLQPLSRHDVGLATNQDAYVRAHVTDN